jgi:hypothetical protein
MHICLNAASAVVSALVPPERPAQILRCAERIIPGDRTGGSWFPWLSISAWRNDCDRTAVSDGVVASARVVCAILSHAADLLIARDLVEQMRQHRCMSGIATRDLDGSGFQGMYYR